MFDSEQQACPLMRLLGNAVVRGEGLKQQAMALSEDGQRLAYVGPLCCNVTVLDAQSLNEVSGVYRSWDLKDVFLEMYIYTCPLEYRLSIITGASS